MLLFTAFYNYRNGGRGVRSTYMYLLVCRSIICNVPYLYYFDYTIPIEQIQGVYMSGLSKEAARKRAEVNARNIVLLTMRQEPENPVYRKQQLIRISPPVGYIPPRTELEQVFSGWVGG